MKKVIYFIILFGFFGNLGAQKRVRRVDLKVVLDDSLQYKTFWTPAYFHSKVYVINMGPDSVLRTDRLQVEHYIENYLEYPEFPYVGKNLAKGDTLTIHKKLWLFYRLDYDSTRVGGFAKILQYKYDSVPAETKKQLLDNTNYIRLMVKSTVVSKYKFKVNNANLVYPNPVNSILHIKTSLNEKPILFSSNMQKVKIDFQFKDYWQIDVTNLAKGIYFIKVLGEYQKIIKT